MGAARAAWDESKHFRGYHGRFAAGSDRTSAARGDLRAGSAFQPRTPAGERRQRLQGIRDAVSIFNRDPRTLSPRDRARVEWASPSKQKAQLQLTGNTLIPRREGMRREAGAAGRLAGSQSVRQGGHRDRIMRNPRTGKLQAYRGTREVELPGGRVTAAKRARRAFDLPGHAQAARRVPDFNPALTSDSRLREIAREMGLEIPKRAGRNQIIKLIQFGGR